MRYVQSRIDNIMLNKLDARYLRRILIVAYLFRDRYVLLSVVGVTIATFKEVIIASSYGVSSAS